MIQCQRQALQALSASAYVCPAHVDNTHLSNRGTNTQQCVHRRAQETDYAASSRAESSAITHPCTTFLMLTLIDISSISLDSPTASNRNATSIASSYHHSCSQTHAAIRLLLFELAPPNHNTIKQCPPRSPHLNPDSAPYQEACQCYQCQSCDLIKQEQEMPDAPHCSQH